MEFTHVNPQRRYSPVEELALEPTGHIHIGASVRPSVGGTPLVGRGPRKKALLAALKDRARRLERYRVVRQVSVYRAVIVPPPIDASTVRPARAPKDDVAVLVDVVDPETLDQVQHLAEYRELLDILAGSADSVHVMPAKCSRSIGRVDRSRQGLFVFQYYTAEDPVVAEQVWAHIAGWYAVETRLDNSDLLVPVEPSGSEYVFVNHARTDSSLPVFFLREFGKRSFRDYVLANLRANHTTFATVVYRLA